MFLVGSWSDFRFQVHFDIFQRKDNQIVCTEVTPLTRKKIAEYPLVNRVTQAPFPIPMALDTPEKRKSIFDFFTNFEINREGIASSLPYRPCHAWQLGASQIVILLQATETENPHPLIWQQALGNSLTRFPADMALTHDIQACRTPEECTTYLKDRRITLIHGFSGKIDVLVEQIKSKFDSSKVLTHDNWAVTVVVAADLASGAAITNPLGRAGHASIVIESVQDLTHKIQLADLIVEDIGMKGSGRAVVRLAEYGVEKFDTSRYQGRSETMIISKTRVEKMIKRINWEKAQQEQGTPKVNYQVNGSCVNRPGMYRTIDVFDSREIYDAVQMLDPPATAIIATALPNPESEKAWKALDNITEESSFTDFVGAAIAPITTGFKDYSATSQRVREIEEQARKVGNQAYRAKLKSLKQRDNLQSLVEEKGMMGAVAACEKEAKEAGLAAQKAYELTHKAAVPALIRVEEEESFRPERGGVKKYVEVKTLPDNCDTWVMHKISLIGKRLHLDAFSEAMSVPSRQIGMFVLEDIPLPPEPSEASSMDPNYLLQLIRKTGDGVRIKEAEVYAASNTDWSNKRTTEWLARMEKIRSEDLNALELLNFCSYLAPDNIPEACLQAWLQDVSRAGTPQTFEKAVQVLETYSMIVKKVVKRTDGSSQKVISLQPLLQTTIRNKNNTADVVSIVRRGIDMLNGFWGKNNESIFRGDEVYKGLVSHAEVLISHVESLSPATVEIATVLDKVGIFFQTIGHLQHSEKYFEKSLSIKRAHYKVETHPDVVVTRNYLLKLQGAVRVEKQEFQQLLQQRLSNNNNNNQNDGCVIS